MQTQSNPINRKWHKIITWLTIASFFAQPTAAVFAATPELHAAANGVPIVEINTPSAGGVSHNQFDRFDVNQNGLIFNNSAGMVNTQLAGYIMGNGNLGRGPAKIILTEVMGTRPTNLNGYMEIAGKRADLIIANPNGIQGSGFGFINTARATLATGKPILGAGGTLEGFNVSGGKITIQGSGMDASATTRVDLLARAVEINAGIWAQDLNVITGANQIDSKTLTTTTLTKIKPQQGVAIDVGALGGMYAGKIKLIGTESGVGVNSRGIIQAGTDLVLNSQGKITLTGTTLAGNDLAISAREGITNQETLYAKEQLTLESAGKIENSGLLGAGSSLAITAGDSLKNSGTAFAEKTLQLKAVNINNTEGYIEAGQLALKTQSINNTKGKILQLGNADLAIEVSGTLDNTAGELAANANALTLSANKIQNQNGKILHGGKGKLAIGAQGQLENNEGTIRTNGSIQIAAKNLANRQGEIFSAGTADIDIAEKLGNAGGSLASGSALVLKAKAVENKAGNIEAATLQLTANVLDNGDKGRIVSTGISQMQVEVTDKLANQGLIGSNGALAITAGQLENTNGQITAENVQIKAQTVSNQNGKILDYGEGEITAEIAGILDNTKGQIASNAKLHLKAGTIENQAGNIEASTANIAAGTLHNGEAGRIASLGESKLNLAVEGELTNKGLIGGNGAVEIGASQVTNQNGQITAKKELSLSADTVSNAENGTLLSGSKLTLTAAEGIENEGAMIAAADTVLTAKNIISGGILQAGVQDDGSMAKQGSLTVNAAAAAQLNGKSLAAEDIKITAENVNLTNSETLAGRNLNLVSSKDTDTTNAVVSAQQNLTIAAESLHNKDGRIAAHTVAVQAATLDNTGGKILHYGKEALTIETTGTLDNSLGEIAANAEAFTVRAGQIRNQNGTFAKAGSGTANIIANEGIHNEEGTIESGGALHLDAKTVENQRGNINAAQEAQLTVADKLDNTAGQIASNAKLRLKAGAIENQLGSIEADTVNITAGTLHNGEAGRIASLGQREMQIMVEDKLTNQGLIGGNGKVQISGREIANQKGQITAKEELSLNADTINNAKGAALSSGGNLALDATKGIDNQGAISATANAKLTAKNITSGGTLQAGIDPDGTIAVRGNLIATAKETLVLSGKNLAAEDMILQGANINLATSETLAGRDLTAIAAKDVVTKGAVVSANRKLTIDAEKIENQKGQLAADQVALHAASLDNTEGKILHYGKEELTVNIAGRLDNSLGEIAANAENFTVKADSLLNKRGKIVHSGSATLEVTANDLDNSQGEIIANGSLSLRAETAKNAQGTIAAQKQAEIAAKTFNNGNGAIETAQGLQVVAENLVNADGGKIINLSGTLAIAAKQAINNDGTIGSNGDFTLQSAHLINQGQLSSQKNLEITAENLENQNGTLLAGGALTAKIAGTLKNSGTLQSGTDLSITAQAINSTGTLASGIDSNGQVRETGALTIAAETLAATGKNLASNIKLDAKQIDLTGSATYAKNDLNMTSEGIIRTKDAKVSAGGKAKLRAKEGIENNGGQIEAGAIDLEMESLDNSQGKILQYKDAAAKITATGTINNTDGQIAANGASLTINSVNLKNTGGQITYAGANELKVIADREMDNTAGNIHSNGKLALGAENLQSLQGEISAMGDMKLTLEQNLQNEQGKIISDKQLEIIAKGNIENTQGTLAGKQSLSLAANNLNNGQGGNIASGGDLELKISENLTNNAAIAGNHNTVVEAKNILNQKGQISAGQNMDIKTSELMNDASLIAGGNLAVTAQRDIAHTGNLIAGGNVKLDAGSITSTGTIGAGIQNDGKLKTSGDLIINSKGEASLTGKNLAGGNLALAADQINLTGAETYAGQTAVIETKGDIKNQNGSLNARGKLTMNADGDIVNEAGTIAAGNLSLQAAALNNQSGKIFSDETGEDQINLVNELSNINGEILLAGNTASLQAKTLNNQSGKIAQSGTAGLEITLQEGLTNKNGQILTNANLTVNALTINNQQGTISGQKDMNLTGKNAIDNVAGKILSGGALHLETEQTLTNSGGKIEAAKGLVAHANQVNNAINGQILNLGTENLTIAAKQDILNQGTIAGNGSIVLIGKTADNHTGKISAGADTILQLSEALNNNNGSVYAGKDLLLKGAGLAIDNTKGTIEAKNNLDLSAKQLQNAAGKIIAGTDLSLVTPTLSEGGTVQAGNNMNLTLAGDYLQKKGSSFTANGSLNLSTTGNITNEGTISAVKDLALTAGNVSNKETGVLTANQNLTVKADKTLQNDGRMDADTIDLTAKDLVNTGAVIGGNLTIHTNTLQNSGSRAILATTEGMNLFVKNTLDNKDHATIYSLGSIKIAADEAQNKTGQVINQSATIEAGENIGIYAGELTNKRSEFETEEKVISQKQYAETLPYDSESNGNSSIIGAVRTYVETIVETTVTKDSGKAQILAGNNMEINANSLTNHVSEIIAGNNLNVNAGTVNNISVDFKRRVTQIGRDTYTSVTVHGPTGGGGSASGGGGGGSCRSVNPNFMAEMGRSNGSSEYSTKTIPYHQEFVESIPGYAAILQGKQSITINAKNINNITTNPDGSVAGNASTLMPGSNQTVQDRQKGINTGGAGATDTSTGVRFEISAEMAVQSSGKKQTATTAPLVFGDNMHNAGQQQKNQQHGRADQYKTSLMPEALQKQIILQNQLLNIGKSASGTKTSQPEGKVDLSGNTGLSATTGNQKTNIRQGIDFGKLPVNGLFNLHPEPASKYLVETDKRFTDYKTFLSSDYLLTQVGYDPAKALKRLGDGFYEQQLVRDQIEAKTGQLFLEGYTNNEEQYKELLNNGIKVAQDFELTLGIALSPEQINALTEDIVWMVEKEIQGQNVLVPVVYLAPGNAKLNPSGAVIQGNNVTLNAEEKITNTGNIMGDQTKITGENILNRGGTISGSTSLDLTAEKDILNQSGTIKGGEINLNAGRDIKNQTVTSPVNFGSGEQTMVSQTAQIKAEGNLNINAGQDITNQGSQISGADIAMDAGRDLTVETVAQQSSDYFTSAKTQITSQITAEGNLSLNAGKDLTLENAKATAGKDLTLKAGQDVKITTTVDTVNKTGAEIVIDKVNQSNTQKNNATELKSGGSIDISAGNDLTMQAGKLDAKENISLNAQNQLNIESATDTSYIHKAANGDHSTTSAKTNVTTDLTAGKSITIESGNDLALKGAKVNAGDTINITSGGDLTLTSEKDERKTQIHNKIKGGWEHTKTADEQTVSTDLNAKNNITLTANGKDSNILIQGSNAISENGKISLAATKDITIKETMEEHESQYDSHVKKRKLLSSKTTDKHDYSLENDVIGSNLSGDSIEIKAGQDLNIKGSNVVGTNDVDLSAGGDVNIESAAKTGIEEHESQTKKSGLFSGGGLGFTIGKRTEKDSTKEKILANQASTIGSVEGNVTIKAGEKVDIEGSNLIAKEDIDITGKQVNIDNSTDTYDYERKYELKQSGLSVSLGGKIINTAMDTVQNAEKSTHVEGDRLAALYGYETAKDIKNLGKELDGVTGKNAKDHISVNISIGSSKTTLEEKAYVETVNPSDIRAGNNVNITATKGDIDLTATKITGKDIELNAKENIHIESAKNKQNSESKMESNSWSLGYDIGGGISGSYNKGSNKENEKNTAHVGSEIKAENEVNIESGKDTGIIGSTVTGGKVTATIGGDLNIESKQDEKTYDQSGKNMGISHNAEDKKAGTSSGLTGGKEESKIDSDYNSVIDQAGIYAGEGGFNIEVGKNTDLKGGIIASEATPNKNKISTETLTYSDIENKAEYNASKTGQGLDTRKGSKYNESGLTPANSVTDHDKKESTTHAAIAEGTVEIRSNPGQDISNLSRDTENALNQLGEIFDKKESEERLELAEKFGQHAFELVHKIGDELGWNPGSPGKVALHAAIGGIMAKLGGNDFKTGAMSGALNEALINEIAKIGDPALQQWVSYIVGKAAAEAVGGDGQSGGSVTASGTKNNDLFVNPVLDLAMLMVGCYIVVTVTGEQVIKNESGKVVAMCNGAGEWISETGESIGKTIDDLVVWAKESSKSGKEKANDVPSWARGERPRPNESGKDFAKRVCDERFGEGNYKKGPDSDYNKIKKWGDRGF